MNCRALLIFLLCLVPAAVYGQSPQILGMAPASGAIGTQVQINGTGFGSSQGASTVTFNSVSAPVTSWSDSLIVVGVPAGASSGSFVITVSGQSIQSPAFTVTPLPAEWADADIGNITPSGTAAYSSGTFTVSGAGTGISGTADGFHFVYQPLTGDGSIVARVASLQGAPYPYVGLMFRDSLAAGAINAFVFYLPNTAYLKDRATTDGGTGYQTGGATTPASLYWLKLVRSGNVFTAFNSPDGSNWTQVGSAITLSMSQSAYVGMAVSAGSSSYVETATIDNVSLSSATVPSPTISSLSATTASVGTQVLISGSHFGSLLPGDEVLLNGSPVAFDSWSDTAIAFTVSSNATSGLLAIAVAPSLNQSNTIRFSVTNQPLPSKWLDADIGAVGNVGAATYSTGIFTVNGAGSGIANNADAFHFVYQPLTGDGSIVARVASLQGAPYPYVGLMFRDSLAAGAINAFVFYLPNTAYLKDRATTDGSTGYQSGGATTPATLYWLKLVRSGNVFTAFNSPDGSNWTQVGSAITLSMSQSAYVGIAVSAGSSSYVETATIDNVSLGSPSVLAPTITSLSATTGGVGTQVQINGANFGALQSGSMVTLNDSQVTVDAWSDTAIIFTVPTGATSGLVNVLLAPSMNSSNAVKFTVTTQPLPSPWVDADIGPVGSAGSATYSSGTFTIRGSGTIWNTSDTTHFVYQAISGDGSIVARVTSQQGGYPEVGVMVRESLSANSSSAFAWYWPNTSYLYTRNGTGASTGSQTGSGAGAGSYWLKLIRNGNTFIADISPDGLTWTQIATTSVAMANNAYIGLAVSSQSSSTLTTATIDNVTVTFGTTPYVSSISPLTAGVGATVTITGSNFGSLQGASTLKLNGATANIVSWADTQIVATVPAGITAGKGPVIVTVNSIASNSNIQFTAIDPVLNNLSPPAAAVGGTVTLTGTGFGSATNQVMFGSVQASVNSWSNSSIQVSVPYGATSAPVAVVINGFSSNGLPFTVEGQPNTASVFPNMGTVGSTVTISGSGFGASQSMSTVNFDGVNAAVTSWSDTEIEATVPAGATTGPVAVTVAGLSGTTVPFTVASDVQLTDSAGNVTDYTFSMQGGTWHTIASQGSGCSSCTVRGVTQQDYDSSGNMLDETDALGHKVSYTYDGNSNMLSQSEPLDANTTVGWTYTYNSFGEVLTATDPLGNMTTNTYDTHGNLLTVTTPKPDANTAASVTTFGYDTKGELTTITDPLNHVTTLTYTPAGLIQTITDAQNNVTTYGYDAHGNRTSVIDAMNHETDFAYDAGDRLTTITYPDHTTTGFGYDYRGRRTSVTDQNGKVTTYAYDDADRLNSVTDAANHVTQYAYDDENNLVSITDANNHITSFQYDQFGRVKETDFPSGHAESYIYDAIGNLITKTDRNGNAITYVYDALYRLTHKGYPDSTGVDYIYDLVGKIKSVTDPTGTYGFAYDNMGRLIGTTSQYSFLPSNTYTNAYTYDAASNRTGFTAPDGSTNTYIYDSLNRLSTLTNSLTGQFGFGYDALSRRTSLTRPNGVNTSYSYDTLSRLLSILHQSGAATIDGANYTLDSAGNRTSKQNLLNGITENYTYDPIYQLTQVDQIVNGNQSTTETYNYDAVGNRLSSLSVASYIYNNSNQLSSSADGYSYTYDANGNTLTRANSSGTTTYAWDFENQLTSATLPNGGGTLSYRYDPFGRRVQKSGPNGITNYVYDGENPLEEVDSGGNVLARYTLSWHVDDFLSALRSGTTSYYQQDGIGSVTALSNSAGTLANTYTYNSFGNLTASTGSITNPFRFTGRDFDSETGLYNYRSRYFDPAVGRFTEEDVVGFNGGKNFYAYVENNPITEVDPMGTAKCIYSITAHTLICIPNADPGWPAIVGPNGQGAVQLGPGGVWSGVKGCANNTGCIGSHDLGPIVPGNYNMNQDDRSGHAGFWRLEPDPKIPGWKCRLGLARCGFELHPGSISLGCITTNKTDPSAMQQYNAVNGLLNQENGSNQLTVVP